MISRSSVVAPVGKGKPIRDPITWFKPLLPGQRVTHSREARPPLRRRSKAVNPVRVDPCDVIAGDRFGCRVVLSISCAECRRHGWPCHHSFQSHTVAGCSDDDPGCPCYGFYANYRAVCRCDCGTVRVISLESLCCGVALSCGRRECRSPQDA
jgi:hypothetical protein